MTITFTKAQGELIESAIFPIIVELKCEFLKALPSNMSIRDRRDRMVSLDKAGDAVLNMPLARFDVHE